MYRKMVKVLRITVIPLIRLTGRQPWKVSNNLRWCVSWAGQYPSSSHGLSMQQAGIHTKVKDSSYSFPGGTRPLLTPIEEVQSKPNLQDSLPSRAVQWHSASRTSRTRCDGPLLSPEQADKLTKYHIKCCVIIGYFHRRKLTLPHVCRIA